MGYSRLKGDLVENYSEIIYQDLKSIIKEFKAFQSVPWPYTRICKMYMGRSLHIYIEHRYLETRKTLDYIFVQVRNFLLAFEFKGSST